MYTTVYRIHGTNQPTTIGTAVSSGCFRLTNPDVADLYDRVPVGTKVDCGRIKIRLQKQVEAGDPPEMK